MKERNQFRLQFGTEVDHQIATRQNVQLREGRIHNDVLRCEDHHFSDLFFDPKTIWFLAEVSEQTFFGNATQTGFGKKP